MSRRILVTGGTGETGRYTTDLLISQGFEVRALVHKADERSKNSGPAAPKWPWATFWTSTLCGTRREA
jgi:uncharacterized protein YbjT (DUF2867 family)